MPKWIAILDTWLVMTITSFFMAVGLLSAHGLLRGQGSGSWQNVILCLVEGGLGFCLIARFINWRGKNSGRVLFVLQFVMVLVLAWILWFQATPWLNLNDSAPVRQSLERELMLQRLEQIGRFLLIVIPIIGLGLVHRKLWEKGGTSEPSTVRGRVPLVAVVAVVLGLVLIARLTGESATGLAIQGILLAVVTVVMLFEFARRAVRAESGVLLALAVTVIGIPIVSFWR